MANHGVMAAKHAGSRLRHPPMAFFPLPKAGTVRKIDKLFFLATCQR